MAGTDALRRHLHVTVYNGRDFEQDTAVVMHVSVRANEVLQLQTSAQDNIDGNFESPCLGAPRDKSGRLLRLVQIFQQFITIQVRETMSDGWRAEREE